MVVLVKQLMFCAIESVVVHSIPKINYSVKFIDVTLGMSNLFSDSVI